MANEVIEQTAGTDWVTVTTVDSSQTEKMMASIHQMIDEYMPENTIGESWSSMGYTGMNYGPIKYGRRNLTEGILIVSGGFTDKVMIDWEMPFDRITRLDLQVSIGLRDPNPSVAYDLRNELRNLPESSRTGKLWTYHSSPSGDTINIGKRGRDKYLRLYDKSLDMGHSETGHIWRYEVEFRGNTAKRACMDYYRAGDRYRWIAGVVFAEFKRRNINPLYKVNVPISAMEAAIEVTTPDQKIQWLERCVTPVVTQLINLGYEAQVIHSLKLSGIYRQDGV